MAFLGISTIFLVAVHTGTQGAASALGALVTYGLTPRDGVMAPWHQQRYAKITGTTLW